MNQKQVPFGINIAARVAAQAIKEGIAPPSIVLAKLFSIQKDIHFPPKLEVEHFRQTTYRMSDVEKKATVILLEEFKKPNVNVVQLLETVLNPGWVVKKVPPKTVIYETQPFRLRANKGNSKQKVEPTTPDVVVKKSKLGN